MRSVNSYMARGLRKIWQQDFRFDTFSQGVPALAERVEASPSLLLGARASRPRSQCSAYPQYEHLANAVVSDYMVSWVR